MLQWPSLLENLVPAGRYIRSFLRYGDDELGAGWRDESLAEMRLNDKAPA